MKTVFFDIDTQLDFVFPAGALYAPGAELLIPTIAKLNRHAAVKGYPLVSTMDAHLENDPEFRAWPPHCVAGTNGQSKPASTLLESRLIIPAVDSAERIDEYQQLLLEKRHVDCFTNPNMEGLLLAFDADRYVVYGVVTEVCVKFAAMGLIERGKNVEVVTDAICALNPQDAEKTLSEIVERGGKLTNSAKLLAALVQ